MIIGLLGGSQVRRRCLSLCLHSGLDGAACSWHGLPIITTPTLLLLLLLLVLLQLNKLVAVKLAAITSTRLLGSIMGDLQQASRRMRELLSSILAAAATDAAVAAADDTEKKEVQLLKLLLDPLETQVI